MTHAAYIFAGYGLTTLVLAGYATWVVTRRRVLARTLGLDGPGRGSSRPGPSE
jgi:heme exporter protein D